MENDCAKPVTWSRDNFLTLDAERCYLLFTWHNAGLTFEVDDATLLEEYSIKRLHIDTALYTSTNTDRLFLKKTLQKLTRLLRIENIMYS